MKKVNQLMRMSILEYYNHSLSQKHLWNSEPLGEYFSIDKILNKAVSH